MTHSTRGTRASADITPWLPSRLYILSFWGWQSYLAFEPQRSYAKANECQYKQAQQEKPIYTLYQHIRVLL